MSISPIGRPSIPFNVAPEDLIAIVTIHDSQALDANRKTQFRKTVFTDQQGNEGCHIFLHRVHDRPYYSLGRGDTRAPGSHNLETRDVHFPGKSSGMRQFLMLPIWDSNIWRLQSTTETVASVNDVPIQASTNRTKKFKDPLPHAIHLNQDSINHIVVNGLQIDIWLLKSVREVYSTKNFVPEPLIPHLQDVALRHEPWARERYILTRTQVSTNSYRVVQRFTGDLETVKLYQQEQDGRQLRDEEFLRLAKDETDISIVRYLQAVEIDKIPGIITSTHEGFASYAELQPEIKKQHPGLRFAIATKLMRRLFSALDFLHFHGIVHGQVSKESVLLRLRNYRLEGVLLVDYSNSTSFISGTLDPLEELVEDGQAVMQVVEDCCDIWQLRKAATKDASNEEWMREKTVAAKKHYDCVYRVVSDYFERQGKSRTSEKGKKLLRLLEQKQNNWHICQNDQIHNATLREVGLCQKSNIDEMVKDWNETHAPPKIEEKVFMNLSLGHPWLDSLASRLYHKRWDLTPHEISAKIRELAGDIEDPWQTFEVEATITFQQTHIGFDEKCIVAWLAGCCEAYPEWRRALKIECERYVRPQDGIVQRHDIDRLRGALSHWGTLPQPMMITFTRLMAVEDENRHGGVRIQEKHNITYHLPSRLFNLTQLQRLSSTERFLTCVSNGDIRCDNFVEVRGQSKLQGCYAPLSLLPMFANQLGLEVPSPPISAPLLPTFDPSDFSQVPPGKIVLARVGLLAFASVTRSGDQFVFHAPKYPNEFETGSFLPTYFGDMKVLPRRPQGIYEYFRPDHWSKFRTAEEIEEAADLGKRKILRAKGPLSRISKNGSSPKKSTAIDVDEDALTRELKHRAVLRSQARLPTKRNTDAQSSDAKTPTAKRSRPSILPVLSPTLPLAPQLTMSFLDRAADNMERIAEPEDGQPGLHSSFFNVPRIPNTSFFQRNGGVNTNLLSSPPRTSMDKNHSFTIPAGSFDLDDDWKQANEWLALMPDSDDDEPQVSGIFGFRFHHSHLEKGSDTEEEEVPEKFRKGKGKAREKAVSKSFTYGQPPFVSKRFAWPKSGDTEKTKEPNSLMSTSTSFSNHSAAHRKTSQLATLSPRTTNAFASMSFDQGVSHRRRAAISSLADVTRGAQDQAQAQRTQSSFVPSTMSSQSETIAASSIGQTAASTSFPLWRTGQAAQIEGVRDGVGDIEKDGTEAVQRGHENEDMPDTDVESWGDEEE